MRRSPSAGLLLVVVLLSRPACGADLVPRLVRDILPASYAGNSSPRELTGVDHGFVFTAFGRELWQYDSREDVLGALLRKEGMRRLAGAVYVALESSGKWTLWSVSGVHLALLRPLTVAPLRSIGVAYREATNSAPLLFDADGGAGRGLWVTDLFNAEATVEIARPRPLDDGRLIRDLTSYHHRFYFVARHEVLGMALWVTDGTRAGTYPIFVPPSQEGTPLSIVGIVKGRLLLAVPGPGAELWSSDGTRRGTRPLQEIVRGAGSARIHSTVMAGGHAFLIVDDGRHGRELWTSDGMPTGARRLTDFTAADPFGATGLPNATVGSRLLFFADDGAGGNEPWWSDGTAAGTHPLADLCPGPCSSDGAALAPLKNSVTGKSELLFSAATPGLGRELWRTDGTPAGTSLVRDFCAGPCSGDPGDVQTLGGSSPATLTAAVATGERALWTMDATPGETERLTPPGVAVARGDRLTDIFAASDAQFGDELWITGGTPGSTRMWADIGRVREGGSYPLFLGTAGDRLIFSTYFPLQSRKLWSSDGTEEGTVPLPGRGPWLGDSSVSSATAGGRTILDGDEHGREGRALWAVDGTPSGTVRLTPPEVWVSRILAPLHGRVLFVGGEVEHGQEIWVSEGTPETTHVLVDLVPGPDYPDVELGNPDHLLFGSLLFSRSDDAGHLWLTDGTAEGTRPLRDVAPFLHILEESGLFAGPTEFRGKHYFGIGQERRILVSDGTAAGTQVWDFPGAPHLVGAFYPGASKLFFTVAADEPNAGADSVHLWVTDGTAEGTTQVPLPSGINLSDTNPVVFRDRLLFASASGHYWVTDGSADGTFPLRDPDGQEISVLFGRAAELAGHLVFASGSRFGICYDWTGDAPVAAPIPGAPLCGYAFRKAGSRLFFSGFEPHTGAELWVLEEK